MFTREPIFRLDEVSMKPSALEIALEHVRDLCSKLPEMHEVEAWGHPTFRAGKKMFAAVGGPTPDEPTLGMRVGFERQDELLEDLRFFPTPYSAHQGWVSIRLGDETDWEEIGSLLAEAYKTVALKRMLKLL
jgi:predicted DNA-binding protein (MmcQ/YjbR family)